MDRAADLKTKLHELSKLIAENEDYTSETIDQAQETFTALKKYQLHASAQHRSHVPKFGNWDRDNNTRYTTYFEDARKAKAVEKMNPDDNPEAYVNGDLKGLNSIQDPLNVDSDKNKSEQKHHGEGNMGHNPQQGNTYNHQKSGSNKSTVSESGSDKSNSSHSRRQSGQQRVKSDRKKGSGEGSNSFSKSVHGHTRQRSGSNTSNGTHSRGASVPKFGDWDERDPSSGEGFTAIFKKLKEEKQIIASADFPAAPAQARATQINNKGSSYKSMMFCCLIPSISG